MPFDLPKLKFPTVNLTLALVTATTLMVACEVNGDTPSPNQSSALTYNDGAAIEDSADVIYKADTSYKTEAIHTTGTVDSPDSTTTPLSKPTDSKAARTELADSECPIAGNLIIAKSVRVIDGDTLEIIPTEGASERIRLLGIDAPESNQAHGAYSTQTLQQCVSQGQVSVEWFEQDRYQRLLGKVRANGVDCNLNQIKQGAALHYKQYQNSQPERDRFTYANAEVNARQQAMGLWANALVTAPWDYRRGRQNNYQFDNTLYPVEGTKCTLNGRRTAEHSSLSNTQAPNQNSSQSSNQSTSQPNALLSAPVVVPSNGANSLDCSSMIKKTCSQMSSCEEAKWQLACGNTRLDGDKDGVPCESICPGG